MRLNELFPFFSKPAIASRKQGRYKVDFKPISTRASIASIFGMAVCAVVQNNLLRNVCENAGYVSYTVTSDDLKRSSPSACPLAASYLLTASLGLAVYAIEWARAGIAAKQKNESKRRDLPCNTYTDFLIKN